MTDDGQCFGVVIWYDRRRRRRTELNTHTSVCPYIDMYTHTHRPRARTKSYKLLPYQLTGLASLDVISSEIESFMATECHM